jgi:Domain of unknown function (DUF6429)
MDQDIDPDRIDEAILALLWLSRHDGGWRTWKGFDWDAMDRLHRKGLISDPVGKIIQVREQRQPRSALRISAPRESKGSPASRWTQAIAARRRWRRRRRRPERPDRLRWRQGWPAKARSRRAAPRR